MSEWTIPLLLSALFVGIPFTTVMRMLAQLPKPIMLCHRRWQQSTNMMVIGGIAFYVTLFIRDAYYSGDHTPGQIAAGFLIAALVYAFGLVLILRQSAGIYPEFIITTGRTGLGLRKVAYRRVVDIEQVSEGRGESHIVLKTSDGSAVPFTLPTRAVPELHKRIRSE